MLWRRHRSHQAHATGDRDGDGESDVEEYAADTNPFNPLDRLQINALIGPRNVGGPRPFATGLTWTSKPSRWYEIETNLDLIHPWLTAADNLVPDLGATTFERFNDPFLASIPAKRFYRVHAKLPLAP